MKIAIAIPLKNEEPRIINLIKHLKKTDADDVAYFDDYSTDKTVELLLQHDIGVHEKVFPKKSTRMSEKRNIILKELRKNNYTYVLFLDADERFDSYFLQNIKKIVTAVDPCISFAFPRINMPGAINYPDFQVRLVKNIPDIEWRGKVHDQLYSISQNKPLVDFIDELNDIVSDTNEYYCLQFKDYHIVHLPRRTDQKRPWW